MKALLASAVTFAITSNLLAGGPPSVKQDNTVDSPTTRTKEAKAKELSVKVKQAHDKADVAKAALEKALSELDALEKDYFSAEADVKISQSKDAQLLATTRRAIAEKAEADAKQAESDSRSAEKAAEEAKAAAEKRISRSVVGIAPIAQKQTTPSVPVPAPIEPKAASQSQPKATETETKSDKNSFPVVTSDLSKYLLKPSNKDKDGDKVAENLGGKPASATINVKVPPQAKIFINNAPTKLVGQDRAFNTSILEANQEYIYVVTVDINGQQNTRNVRVRAGDNIIEDFTNR